MLSAEKSGNTWKSDNRIRSFITFYYFNLIATIPEKRPVRMGGPQAPVPPVV